MGSPIKRMGVRNGGSKAERKKGEERCIIKWSEGKVYMGRNSDEKTGAGKGSNKSCKTAVEDKVKSLGT